MTIRPSDPVREGYRFEGWYTDINLTDEWNFDEDAVQGNMSLYAKWVADASINTTLNDEGQKDYFWWWILLLILLIILHQVIKRKKNQM